MQTSQLDLKNSVTESSVLITLLLLLLLTKHATIILLSSHILAKCLSISYLCTVHSVHFLLDIGTRIKEENIEF